MKFYFALYELLPFPPDGSDSQTNIADLLSFDFVNNERCGNKKSTGCSTIALKKIIKVNRHNEEKAKDFFLTFRTKISGSW